MSKASPNPPVVLVDGSSYLFRAYHALPKLTASSGQPTGAIKGVIGMLRKLRQDFRDSKVIVVFDAKGKNFRHDWFPDYKAHRPPMPEDLAAQIEPLHRLIRAMGLPLICQAGVEADDVIGTLARHATERGIDAVISTGDKDMAQLVNQHITLINTMTDTRMDEAGVKEKFGIKPSQIIDYLALVGDTVDNIPGVPKCGPKTAVKWLEEHGSLEGVMRNADAVGGKIGEYLRASLELLPLSYKLATIQTDVALEQDIEEIMPQPADRSVLAELYQAFGFRGWLQEVEREGATEGSGAPSASPVAGDVESSDSPEADVVPAGIERDGYACILTGADWQQWLERLRQAPAFAFDTETTSLNYMEARIVGVSFATAAGEAAYVPLAHDYLGAPDQLDRERVLADLKPLLEDEAKPKVGQNLKYDMNVLANHGIRLRGIAEDTMLESYVLNSVATRHDMDSLARLYLDHGTIKFEDVAGKGSKQLTFNQVEVEKAAPYAAEDADVTWRLHQALRPRLHAEAGLERVYRELEIPLIPILAGMERQGALVDAQLLARQSEQLQVRMQELEQEAFQVAGQQFNLGSPKQLQEILYDKLSIPSPKKTPTGQRSTAEPVLQELAEQGHELPSVILAYRSLSKLKSTYTDRLPEQLNPYTKRVHTSYHQAVTATGRLSSSDPNLQNIPIRTEEGRRIRQAFIAPDGYRLVAADYSQIELRIMAHLSQDAGLLKAFAEGQDIHRATAAEVFNVPLAEVTGDQRRSAKAINFGLIYGMSAFGLARQIGEGRNTAQTYIDTYFERYPGVLEYMNRIRTLAHEQGYVETLFGRRLYLPEINNRNKGLQAAAERTAINAPMQGTAADIIKRAMIRVDRWLRETGFDARMIMQVHDELVLEVREDQVEIVMEGLKAEMAAAAELAIPLLVEAGAGFNWDEAH